MEATYRLRAQTGRPLRVFALALVLSALASCDKAMSTPAPPREDETIKLPELASTVTLPVTVRLSDIKTRLNAEVPRRLFSIDENRDACVPAQWAQVCLVPRVFRSGCAQWLKTKVSPEIDCHLKGSIDRGDFQVTANGGVLTVSVPLHASVTARGRGEIGKNIQQTAEGSLEARARVTADIGEDWQPTVKVDPDFTWRDRAHVDVLGIKITFASKVEPEIRKAMEQLKSVVDGEVKKLKVRESVDAMWKSGFGVARISADPDVWFRFSPRAIGFSGISSTSDTLEVRVMATGLTQTFVGPQPAPAAPSPLPLLQKNIPHGQFNLYLPVFADYSAAGQSLERLLRVNEKQIFAVPSVGNVAVTFRKVDIYPAKGGAIAVGITLEADPPNRFFDTKGTIWLKANVAVENEGKKLIPKSLDYGAETNNSATNILLAIARLPPVKEKIEKALTYDFSKDYERGLTAANAAMNRSVGKDLTLEGAISEAGIDEIKATANGVYMGIEVSGNLRLRSLASTK